MSTEDWSAAEFGCAVLLFAIMCLVGGFLFHIGWNVLDRFWA